MKKRILGLVFGLILAFLLTGIKGFAADGDLIVNGNIGVGITTPTEKLDVNGNVKATGFIGPGIIRQIQTLSPTTDISTTSTAFVDMPGMSITLTTKASILLIFWNTQFHNTGIGWVNIETLLDGLRVGPTYGGTYSASGSNANSVGGHTVVTVAAGTHTVKLRWRVTGTPTVYNYPNTFSDYYGRTLTVIEVGQ